LGSKRRKGNLKMGKEEVLMLVAKSNECLNEAQALFDLHFYAGAINRSYYSIFNAIQALLQSKDIMVKTHQGAHVQFHQHFIKPGAFNDEMKIIPQKVEALRLKGDYEPDHQMYEEDAQTALLLARQFYDAVKNYMNAKS